MVVVATVAWEVTAMVVMEWVEDTVQCQAVMVEDTPAMAGTEWEEDMVTA